MALKVMSFFVAVFMMIFLVSAGLSEQESILGKGSMEQYEVDADLEIKIMFYRKDPDAIENLFKNIRKGNPEREAYQLCIEMESSYWMPNEKARNLLEHPERFGAYNLIAEATKKGNGYKGYFEPRLLNHNSQAWIDNLYGGIDDFDMYPEVANQRIVTDIIVYEYEKTAEEIEELIESLTIEFIFEITDDIWAPTPRKKVVANLENIRPYSEEEDMIKWVSLDPYAAEDTIKRRGAEIRYKN